MKDYITTAGIVLKTSNLGEYDKRMVILTDDRGKITVFARGVRRQNSKHLAACSPFSFGEIRAFPGKDAYSLMDFNVKNYFTPLRTDYDASCLGMYFLEIADYYARENNDELMLMKLLYVSLRALEKASLSELDMPYKLIKAVFQIKAICVNGEFPGVLEELRLSEAAEYTINYIASTKVEQLFAFKVSEEVLSQLSSAGDYYATKFIRGRFKSLELLDI